ncbi:PREDICTED: DNA repair protein REV1 isoform X2 [Tarenaya hassleriana]|uniref:DNA repair protein REV1 isoform X2 n=1 Tax=Tarenaya hassleriana TaxID=28532 RepID=UPI00053C4AEE|nr:PREDICTED: DNA repair protein REV1 isoform X2 [Tarenaya hassleriana]
MLYCWTRFSGSADSCLKMKRSLGSKSSNNSSSSSNTKAKKKKTTSNQKTLGVAWGAASLSSSRSSFRSSPFSDFGSYMSEKNRKLHNQFDAEASTDFYGVSGSENLIFQGVSIFVDGFTVPSSQELRGYMLKYGGRFENYFSRRSVTHIICSNLPDSKIKNLRSFSRGLPVVKPTWILDSISAKRLLSWVPYQLDQLTDAQPKLSAFFAPKSHSVPEVVSTDMTCQPTSRFCDIRMNEAEVANLFRAAKFGEGREHENDETDGVYLEITTRERMDPAISGDRKSSELNSEELDYCGIEEKEVNSDFPSCSEHPPASTNISFCENDTNDDISTATTAVCSKRRHSTLEDPNFVENYFKSSRLHFIGTWRKRYRKRFHGSSDGLKSTDSGHNAVGSPKKTAFIHIDLDCFFVSVVIKNCPELQDKPVAVCHSDNPKGTAEISSANYPARAYGVKAGMFVRNAKDLCPQLIIVPYNFEAYEEVADHFYDILHKHCRKVQAISCDEAFLDVSDLDDVDPEILASMIRKEVFETTGCSASAGIGSTMLMARLATRTAKPAGQFHIPSDKVDEYLDQLPVDVLPGVGYVLKEKLKKHNIQTCSQLRLVSKDSLQKDFGMKTGEMLWSYSRGLDHRSVRTVQENKSIGADVNWGVRFRNQQDIQHFLQCLCKEVSLRLQGCEMLGRTFTLKIKKRRKDAAEPAKYMGCGDCDNLSRSITVPVATDDVEVLQRISKKLFGSFFLDVKEIRGVGLQVSKLESVDSSKRGSTRTLESYLSFVSAQTEQRVNSRAAKVGGSSDCERHVTADDTRVGESDRAESSIQTSEIHSFSENQASSVPPLCHLDMEVLESLPSEVVAELDQTYGGKLVGLIEKRRGKGKTKSNSSLVSLDDVKSANSLPSKMCSLSTHEEEECEEPRQGISSEPTIEMADLMPLSFSQVDISVLQELPEDLRAGLLGALPAHRKQHSPSDTPTMETEHDKEPVEVGEAQNEIGFSDKNLWIGNPPIWVEKFKVSSHHILKNVSEMYCKLVVQSRPKLSSILQHAIFSISSSYDSSANDLEEALYNVCELLRQYIKLKIEGDIEEIYLCFRLLKRLALRCQFFLQVYEIVSPFLQACIGENYGGNLNIS